MADRKLQDYTLTLLNNIQIMYYQPTASPPLTFRVIRYEVLTRQPVGMNEKHNECTCCDMVEGLKELVNFCFHAGSLKSIPSFFQSALAGYLHNHGNAQMYLDRFCRYQRNLAVRDWDHAIMLTG